jgi:hypothetical protein
MLDLVFVFIIVAFFLLSTALIHGIEKLKG